MPVLPGLQPIVDAQAASPPAPAPTSIAQARARVNDGMRRTSEQWVESVAPLQGETDHQVAVDKGSITARVYRPNGMAGRLPVHVYFHGGGFWVGTLEHSDDICRGVATDAECAVVSVDYRLAPEFKFPIPAEDCYKAMLWV